jgi:hypothetical protein
MPYAKFKAYLRKLAERTVPGLHRAMRSFLASLKPSECASYLRMPDTVPYDRNLLYKIGVNSSREPQPVQAATHWNLA